jgi:hypothetical protein
MEATIPQASAAVISRIWCDDLMELVMVDARYKKT